MVKIVPLQDTTVDAYFDEERSMFFVRYRGTLTSEATNRAYLWLLAAGGAVGLDHIRAFIFYFTAVQQFTRENVVAAKKQSTQANALVDLSRIPAALIVKNFYQEQFVLLSMKANNVEERTRICHSQAEALAFIEQFHIRQRKTGHDPEIGS